MRVFAAVGASVLGGHSSTGAELTVGFTVTGLLEREPVTLSGGRAGDVLILTKPIGSGVILAGEMQGRAEGADVLACWEAMSTPQGGRRGDPHAAGPCDDGCDGLRPRRTPLEHLCRFGNRSGGRARCRAAAEGGGRRWRRAASARRWKPQNRAALEPVMAPPDGARAALLFDPQDGGGDSRSR